ncbi:MAG: hypothetical protein AAGE59_23625 [Cyanobacteria bacterium P01_F01_bin.86]
MTDILALIRKDVLARTFAIRQQFLVMGIALAARSFIRRQDGNEANRYVRAIGYDFFKMRITGHLLNYLSTLYVTLAVFPIVYKVALPHCQ